MKRQYGLFGNNVNYYADSPFFSRINDRYDITRLPGILPTSEVLDIATGPGFVAFEYAKKVRRVVGIDVTPQMIYVAKEKAQREGVTNIEFLVADARNIPFEDCSFDIAVCRFALHHFKEPNKVIKEVYRVSRDEFIIEDVCGSENKEEDSLFVYCENLRDISHVKFYTYSDLAGMLRSNYFDVGSYDTFKIRRGFDDWIEPVSDPKKRAEIERLIFETQLSKFLESSKTDRTFLYTINIVLARKKR